MFEATNWILDESNGTSNELMLAFVMPKNCPNPAYKIGLVRRFDFSSKLQRMSVIVKNMKDGNFKSYVKGSPEKIKELCVNGTLPENYDDIQNIYTRKGYRVLALAQKQLKIAYS